MGSTLVDMITSTVIFGVLALTVARVQANINVTMFENQHNVVTQTNSVELARQIEWDFAKIGHHISGQKITLADSTEIRFDADLENKNVTNSIRYYIGDTSQCSMTQNRNDFPMYRVQDGLTVVQNWGLTDFRITYFDASEHRIPTPIVDVTNLAKIHSIKVTFQLESAEPIVSDHGSVWAMVAWEKTIVPRNLGSLNY
jgi:hypothetical protein